MIESLKEAVLTMLQSADISSTDIYEPKGMAALEYAERMLKNNTEENDIEHSYKVFINSFAILNNNTNIDNSKENILILFYASLLHDISKTNLIPLKEEIFDFIQDDKPYAANSSDHGIRSAHYIRALYKKGRIAFFGLDEDDIKLIYLLMAFHSTSWFPSSFIESDSMSKRALVLSLIFWIADVVQCTNSRVEGAATLDRHYLDKKIEAREKISEVCFDFKSGKVIWIVKEITDAVKDAAKFDNDTLSKHALVLNGFGLPSCICVKEEGGVNSLLVENDTIPISQLVSLELCNDARVNGRQLVLTSDTIDGLYEKIVSAFSEVFVDKNILKPINYYCPTLLEIRNVENDRIDNVKIRSKYSITRIKEYTNSWLDAEKGAEEKFYFGYTHGQRLCKHEYPKNSDEFDTHKQWSGRINQFESILDSLDKHKYNTRDAYAIIANPIIDNVKSDFWTGTNRFPSLIAIQFIWEKSNKLSVFGSFRSQELSAFSLVNYLELKTLLKNAHEKLTKNGNNMELQIGRIVMFSSLSYFNPETVLLDKPDIAKVDPSRMRTIWNKMVQGEKEEKESMLRMLKQYRDNPYLYIDTKWCETIYQSLSKKPAKDTLEFCFEQTYNELKALEKEREIKHLSSASEEINVEKKRIIDQLISFIEKGLKS